MSDETYFFPTVYRPIDYFSIIQIVNFQSFISSITKNLLFLALKNPDFSFSKPVSELFYWWCVPLPEKIVNFVIIF